MIRCGIGVIARARLGQGQSVRGGFRHHGEVAICNIAGKALGLGQVDAEGILRPKRLFSWATQPRQPIATPAIHGDS